MIRKTTITVIASITLLLGLIVQDVDAADIRTAGPHPSVRTFTIYSDRLTLNDNWQKWVEYYFANEIDEEEQANEPNEDPIEEPEENQEPIEEEQPQEPEQEEIPESNESPIEPDPEPVETTEPPEQESESEQETNKPADNASLDSHAFERQVAELTNQERKAHGLDPLTFDERLSTVARIKSDDMATNDYFSHESPTYGSPFEMMSQFDISYLAAGENIAQGQTNPEQVVNSWINSEGHRANILNDSFTHIGVGYKEGSNHWTQIFIGK